MDRTRLLAYLTVLAAGGLVAAALVLVPRATTVAIIGLVALTAGLLLAEVLTNVIEARRSRKPRN